MKLVPGSADGPTNPAAPKVAKVAPAPRLGLEPGERVGPYVVDKLLGAGGMGAVYRASDSRLERHIAIKVVQPRLADRVPSLLLEAQAMAKLSHPNVVAVYDVGQLGDQVYVAMELVDGVTLRGWLEQSRRPWRMVVGVFLQAGRGLAAAHAAGIVHRDFKPDNVLVGKDGRVCVSDFGLAGRAPAGDTAEPEGDIGVADTLRFSSSMAGTPAYMSPEQYRGGAVDAKADQFAFCVTLYEALYGERPFSGTSVGEIRQSVLSNDVGKPPPGTNVPAWVRAVVLRGLSRNPAARFPSMDALLAVLGKDPAAGRRTALFGVALAATTGLGLFGILRSSNKVVCDGGAPRLAQVWGPAVKGAVARAFEATGRPYARDITQRVTAGLDAYATAWSAMHRDACEATHVRHEQSGALLDLRMRCLDQRLGAFGELTTLFAAGPDVRRLDLAVDATHALADLDRCADGGALGAVLPPPEDPAARERLAVLRPRLYRAEALHLTGAYVEAFGAVKPLVDEARQIGYAPLLGETLLLAARLGETLDQPYTETVLREALQVTARAHDDTRAAEAWRVLVTCVGIDGGRRAEALALVPAAQAALARAGDPPRSTASLLATVAAIRSKNGDFDEARALIQRAVAIIDKLGKDDLFAAHVYMWLGSTYKEVGDLDGALRAFRRELAIEEKVLGARHPRLFGARNNVASVLQEQRKLDEALEMLEQALAVCLETMGENVRCGKILNNIGVVRKWAGRPEEALAAYQRAVAIKEKAAGPESAETLLSLNNLAEIYVVLGRADEALPMHERAHALRVKVHGPEHRFVAESLNTTGLIRLAQRRYRDAREALEAGLAMRERTLGATHPDVADSLHALGDLARAEGRPADALAAYRRALTIREKARGPSHPEVGASLAGAGAALVSLRRDGEAVEALQRAIAIFEGSQSDPADLAFARFALARALPAPERVRAVALAQAAREEYAREGSRALASLHEVDDWVRKR